jgi:hypothetical protein
MTTATLHEYDTVPCADNIYDGRRRISELVSNVIYLSGSDAETEAGPSTFSVPVYEGPPLDPKRPYPCTFEGCKKAYRKPSRLEEHERSHTGEVSSMGFARVFSGWFMSA